MGNVKHMHKDVVITRRIDGELVVTSRQVAEDFEKMHKHVLRAIEGKISLNPILGSAKYFIESSYKDSTGRSNKEYLLTKDGFTFLVMGFTGAKANENIKDRAPITLPFVTLKLIVILNYF